MCLFNFFTPSCFTFLCCLLDIAISTQKRVLVHCRAGVSRWVGVGVPCGCVVCAMWTCSYAQAYSILDTINLIAFVSQAKFPYFWGSICNFPFMYKYVCTHAYSLFFHTCSHLHTPSHTFTFHPHLCTITPSPLPPHLH